jgi:hypothetical protein
MAMKMLIALIAIALTTNAALALLGSSGPRAQTGLVLAQQDTRPMERTTTTSPMTPRTMPPKHILFSCTDKSCGCKGQDDCFDLGTKGICGPTSGWNCTGNDCTCAKKAQ